MLGARAAAASRSFTFPVNLSRPASSLSTLYYRQTKPTLSRDIFAARSGTVADSVRDLSSVGARCRRRYHATPPTGAGGTLLSRITRRALYRKDGTPRSKLKGLVIATGTSLFLLLAFAMLDLMQDLEDLALILLSVIQIQRIDQESYDSVPWDNFVKSTGYFAKLCNAVLVTQGYASESGSQTFFDMLVDSEQDLNDAGIKDRIHEYMSNASHAVHEALQRCKDEPAEAAQDVVKEIREALEAVMKELEDSLVREVSGWLKKKNLLRDRFEKGPKGDKDDKDDKDKGKDYDIIG